MTRFTGARAVGICCCMVLTSSIAGAAAVAVTHGDLLVVADDPARIKFYSPKGKVKTSVRVPGFNWVFARAISQDGRFAAIGLHAPLEDGGTRALGPPKVPLKIVFLQLSGPSPKVLGIRTLQHVHNPTWHRGKHCHYDPGGNPLALRKQSVSAGIVLHVYLSIICVPAIVPNACVPYDSEDGHSAIQHWSAIYTPSKKLGPLVTGKRAAFPEKTRCDALPITQSLTVTASGKAYVAFVFSFSAAKVYDVIGVYQIRHSYNGKIRLVATWKLKRGYANTGGYSTNFQITGPSSACAAIETPRGTRVHSFGKGRAPYIGGKVATSSTVYHNLYYRAVTCTASQVYAILATEDGPTHDNILRVSVKELSRAASGHVTFQAAPEAIPNILIIP